MQIVTLTFHRYIIPTEPAWPELPEPEPEESISNRFLCASNSVPNAPMTTISGYDLKMTKTRRSAEDVKEEIKIYEPSVYSNYTTAPPEDTLVEEESRLTIST